MAKTSFYFQQGSASSTDLTSFDLCVSVPGVPLLPSEWLFGHVFDLPAAIDTNLSGSKAVAGVGAAAPAVFSVRKNGTQFGTLTYTGTVGVFSGARTTFAPGDLLELIGPTVNDATLAHLSISILVSRT